jgi:hypothetical protein
MGSMERGLIAGAIAGAVGTLALDVVSYLDMLARGRPASSLPGEAAARLASTVGIELGPEDDPATENRKTALGAVLGYSTGVAVGAAYGLLFRRHRRRGLVLGAAAMALANGPMVAQGLTDPRTWGVAGWISDIVPHAAYGIVTTRVLDRITR